MPLLTPAERDTRFRRRLLPAALALALLAPAAGAIAWSNLRAWPVVAWPDEVIYLVGARNVVERGSLDTNFYLTYSLLRRGHPHRDVHMPGYVFALSPMVALRGATFEAGALLNAALFLASIPLVYAIGVAVLGARAPAAAAALLFAVLPPFPGYLAVVYPEHAVAFVFLAGLAVAARASAAWQAAAAGILFGLGALFRESLLAAAPMYAALLPRRLLWRAFAPGTAAALLLVVAPLSQGRAVHPNALYPSVFEEALRTESPLATLTAAVARNVATNLRQAAAADPAASPEDAVLALLLALALCAALSAAFRLQGRARRLAFGTGASLALLTAAVLALYVVRERGGVWGGVRAYMPWAPVLLVLAAPLFAAARRPALNALLAAPVAALFVWVSAWQIQFFNRYKRTDHEDQQRNADYLGRHLDRHRPTRILSRSFLYGYTRYPVEVIWSLPRDGRELAALNEKVAYEFMSIHERSPLRFVLMRNPRYVRVNKDDRGAEFLVFRRLH